MPATDRSGPPPSGIQSPRFAPRHSRFHSAPGGTQRQPMQTRRTPRYRETRSPASSSAEHGGHAPRSSRRPPTASNRGASLDDLVGEVEHSWRNREAERPGGLQIDDQLERRRLLDRKIGRLHALEDLVDVRRRATELVRPVCAIRYEPSDLRELPSVADRSQSPL